MQYAMNSLVGNIDDALADFPGSSYKTTVEGGAVVTLLDDITDGVGFRIGKVNNATSGYAYKAKEGNGANTSVTLDLAGHTYTFASPVTGEGISKKKGIQISEKDSTCTTKVIIKDGVLNIAEQTTGGAMFERLIRSYTDVTIENVTLDGRNVKGQESGENGAVVCHSLGTLTLKGNTSIITQDDTAEKTYYALSGRFWNYTGDTNGARFTINVETSGNDREGKDTTIKNIGLYEYTGTNEQNKRNKLYLKSGNVGEVSFGKNAVDSKGASVDDNLVIQPTENGTLNISSFEYDSTKSRVLYQSSASSQYTLAQTDSWNAVSSAADNKAYNYVIAGDTEGKGTVALKVTNVDDKDALALDTAGKTFGIPDGATASQNGSDYKFAYLNYDKGKTAVTVSSDTADAVIKERNSSLASELNTGVLAHTVKKIDASSNSVALSITANSLDNTIIAGKNQNLTGGTGADVFVYNGGANVITDYNVDQKDLVSLASDQTPVTDVASISVDGNNLVMNFGSGDSLTFTNGANIDARFPNVGIKVNSGNKTYIYNKNSIAEGYGLTLAAGYNGRPNPTATSGTIGYDITQNVTFYTIDGSAVTDDDGLALTGNDSANYFIGSETKKNTLYGGNGNDTLKGGSEEDLFRYTSGKDVIENFGGSDKVSIDSSITITGAKTNAKDQLVFSTKDKANTLTFNPTLGADNRESVVTAVLLAGESSDFLTKDGKVADNILMLFPDTKGRVSVPTGELYNGVNGINASAVTGNVVTMVGADGGTYTFANNKKADVFEYKGGTETVNDYVAGSDKINLDMYTFNGFTASDEGVTLNTSLSSGGGAGSVILNGEIKGKEVLLHDGERNKSNQYSTIVFYDSGILHDKTSKPTTATVLNGATTYDASTTGVKKIILEERNTGASIYAGSVNTVIDASAAGTGVSLFSGAKNDKFTGGSGNDLFVYSSGKDVISGFGSGDSISLGGAYDVSKVTKISKSNKSINLKFSNRDSLTIKSNSAIDSISIDGENYTFGKKSAIIQNGVVSLTSDFSGTYTADSEASSIIGSAVKKNLTIKGQKNIADSIVSGGGNKTKLQGQGGNDTLVGGNGTDTFFYKKGEAGNIKIQNFDAGKDIIKINGSKVIDKLSTDKGASLTINMTNDAAITVDTFATGTGGNTETARTINDILIKANNTYYWFEDETFTDSSGETRQNVWATSTKKISKSVATNSGYAIVDLGYSTNLVKAGLAYKADITLPSASSSSGNSEE